MHRKIPKQTESESANQAGNLIDRETEISGKSEQTQKKCKFEGEGIVMLGETSPNPNPKSLKKEIHQEIPKPTESELANQA